MVTWGSSYFGGDSSAVASQLHDVTKVFVSKEGMAALRRHVAAASTRCMCR